MEYLCLDIKYSWVDGEKRTHYLLSIQDVYTRMILRQVLKESICKYDVINLFRSIALQCGISSVRISNNNGSQFIANDVIRYLKEMEALLEFTHTANPEENALTEAFHNIVQHSLRHVFSAFTKQKPRSGATCIGTTMSVNIAR